MIDSWPFNVIICSKKLLDLTKLSLNLEQSPITPCYNETTETTDISIISIIGMPDPPCHNLVFCNGTKLGTLTVKISCDPSVCPENNFGISVEVIFPTRQVTLPNLKSGIIGQPVTIIKYFVKVIKPQIGMHARTSYRGTEFDRVSPIHSPLRVSVGDYLPIYCTAVNGFPLPEVR